MYDLDLKKIADSGQTFRMEEEAPGLWRVIAADRVLRLDEEDIRIPAGFWTDFFDLGADYARCRAAIPPEDAFLSAAAREGTGIRILRQDPWEMLITFIISQRKNIPAIKKGVEALCSRWGAEADETASGQSIHAFPSPEQLARAGEAELRECSLGYRVPYVMKAARDVADGRADLEALKKLCDEDLMKALMSFEGVGPKVASCVSLFGYHRIAAFPIDVWIGRIIEEEYGGNFPFELYEGFGGVIQQYMFYYGRYRK